MKENCTGYPSFDGREVSCSSMDSCAKLSYNTKDYFTIRDNKDEMKTSIFTDGPGVFRYDVYSDFMDTWNNYSPGKVYKNTGGQYKGGHAVLIIGWDDSKGAWLCKNSWGNTGPNRDGTFWIAYSGHVNNLNFGMANITITSGPVPSDVKSPVYQFVNTLTIDHFFTANEKEKTFITASSVWKYEGIVWYAFTSRQTDTLPVYRFANTITGEHFYTISEIEKNNFIIGGWRYEGIAWHAYGSQKTNTFPVYRLLNTITGEHFYTISETVKNNLVTTTYWKNEGVAWYTYKK